MKITTMGLDLAKNVFQVYGGDEGGKQAVSKTLKRHQARTTPSRCSIAPAIMGRFATPPDPP